MGDCLFHLPLCGAAVLFCPYEQIQNLPRNLFSIFVNEAMIESRKLSNELYPAEELTPRLSADVKTCESSQTSFHYCFGQV